MSYDQAVLNRIWSETILTELHRFGVKHGRGRVRLL